MKTHYEPIETLDLPVRGGLRPSAGRCDCPVCEKTFNAGAIVTDPAQPIPQDQGGGWSIVRYLFCDCCVHIITWAESADAAGGATGTVISGPGFIRGGKAVAAFLKKHPHAAGVVQS